MNVTFEVVCDNLTDGADFHEPLFDLRGNALVIAHGGSCHAHGMSHVFLGELEKLSHLLG